MNKYTKIGLGILFCTQFSHAENFSWSTYEKEIDFDYISSYENNNKLTPAEKTKKYIKKVHNIDASRESLKEIKEKRNDKMAIGLAFRNPKEWSVSTSSVDPTTFLPTTTTETKSLDSFGLKLSSRLDLSALGWSSDKYANINVFSDLVELSVSKRIHLDDFDIDLFGDLNKWNGPYLEAGVGMAYQIKETIKEEGLSPMIMMGAGWNFKNEYEAKYELSIPSDYQKGTLSRFSISSLF